MSYYVLFSKNQWNPHTKFLAICDSVERAKDLWYQWREDDDDITDYTIYKYTLNETDGVLIVDSAAERKNRMAKWINKNEIPDEH